MESEESKERVAPILNATEKRIRLSVLSVGIFVLIANVSEVMK